MNPSCRNLFGPTTVTITLLIQSDCRSSSAFPNFCPAHHQCWSLGGVRCPGRAGGGGRWSHCHKPTHFCHLPSHVRPLPNSENTLPGMTWFGHGEVEKTSTRFSFHRSNPQNPAGWLYLCLNKNTTEHWTVS